MEPLELGKLKLLDALVYGLVVDTTMQSAVVMIEVEPAFHVGIAEYIPGVKETTVLVDAVFTGAEAIWFSGLRTRPDEWDAEEKPHDYEISRVSVRKMRLRRDLYEAEILCDLGQIIRIRFRQVNLQLSQRSPGVTKDYGGRKIGASNSPRAGDG